jgi:hypothetical protein
MLFQLSAELFWGFQVELDLAQFTTEADVIKEVKSQLKEFMLMGNLQVLAEEVDKLHLHLHQDLHSEHEQDLSVVYICDRKHSM